MTVAVFTAVVAACASEGGAPADVAQGEGLFAANCAACHGAQAQGTQQGPPLVDVIYEPSHHDDDAFRRAMNDGVIAHHWNFGHMPPVAGLGEEEMAQVIRYVRDLQARAGIQ